MEPIPEENSVISAEVSQATRPMGYKKKNETGELNLDLHDVCYYVGAGADRKNLLQNVNLHLGAGEMSALMGPSGAGEAPPCSAVSIG